MPCKFNRDGEYIICEYCGFKLKTTKEPNKVHKECFRIVQPEKQYPSVFSMITNAAGALVNFIGDGFKIVEETEQTRRLDICKGCDQYDKEQNRCYQCGCYLTFKSKIEGGGCPLGKW